MGGQVTFSFQEMLEVLQRCRELEAENRALRDEKQRLEMKLEMFREDQAAYYKSKTTAKAIPTDRSGVVTIA